MQANNILYKKKKNKYYKEKERDGGEPGCPCTVNWAYSLLL